MAASVTNNSTIGGGEEQVHLVLGAGIGLGAMTLGGERDRDCERFAVASQGRAQANRCWPCMYRYTRLETSRMALLRFVIQRP